MVLDLYYYRNVIKVMASLDYNPELIVDFTFWYYNSTDSSLECELSCGLHNIIRDNNTALHIMGIPVLIIRIFPAFFSLFLFILSSESCKRNVLAYQQGRGLNAWILRFVWFFYISPISSIVPWLKIHSFGTSTVTYVFVWNKYRDLNMHAFETSKFSPARVIMVLP